MKFSRTVMTSAGALILTLTASAQTRAPYPQPNDPNYRNGDPYYRNGNPNQQRGYGNQTNVVRRALDDLNRAAASVRFDNRDRRSFNDAANNLQQFDERLATGRFDTGKLDRAIRSLDGLVRSRWMRNQDRDMLARDVAELRQFRATRGAYGNYSYR